MSRAALISSMVDVDGGRYTDSQSTTRILDSPFWRYASAIGIIYAVVIMTISSFALRTLSLSYNVLGPWPDSFDYTYGAVGLLHGTYEITWDRCPIKIYETGLTDGSIDPDDCAAPIADHRKSFYTPGTSILMLPFVAVGGDTAATLLDYTSALAIATTIAILVWRLFCPPLAFVAVLLYVLSPATAVLSSMALSDLPTALFLMFASILLASMHRYALLSSGIVAGYLVWLRPQMAVLMPVTILVAILLHHSKHKLLLHIVPLCIVLGGLGFWQYVYYGTPFTTGYQFNAGQQDTSPSKLLQDSNKPPIDPSAPNPNHSPSIADFFSRYYLSHPAWHSDNHSIGGGVDISGDDNIPTVDNAQSYALLLSGLDPYLLPFGVGIIGLFGLVLMALDDSRLYRSIGLIGIYAICFLFVTYTFYYYRSGRFFVPIAPFLLIGATYLTYRFLVQVIHTYKLLHL